MDNDMLFVCLSCGKGVADYDEFCKHTESHEGAQENADAKDLEQNTAAPSSPKDINCNIVSDKPCGNLTYGNKASVVSKSFDIRDVEQTCNDILEVAAARNIAKNIPGFSKVDFITQKERQTLQEASKLILLNRLQRDKSLQEVAPASNDLCSEAEKELSCQETLWQAKSGTPLRPLNGSASGQNCNKLVSNVCHHRPSISKQQSQKCANMALTLPRKEALGNQGGDKIRRTETNAEPFKFKSTSTTLAPPFRTPSDLFQTGMWPGYLPGSYFHHEKNWAPSGFHGDGSIFRHQLPPGAMFPMHVPVHQPCIDGQRGHLSPSASPKSCVSAKEKIIEPLSSPSTQHPAPSISSHSSRSLPFICDVRSLSRLSEQRQENSSPQDSPSVRPWMTEPGQVQGECQKERVVSSETERSSETTNHAEGSLKGPDTDVEKMGSRLSHGLTYSHSNRVTMDTEHSSDKESSCHYVPSYIPLRPGATVDLKRHFHFPFSRLDQPSLPPSFSSHSRPISYYGCPSFPSHYSINDYHKKSTHFHEADIPLTPKKKKHVPLAAKDEILRSTQGCNCAQCFRKSCHTVPNRSLHISPSDERLQMRETDPKQYCEMLRYHTKPNYIFKTDMTKGRSCSPSDTSSSSKVQCKVSVKYEESQQISTSDARETWVKDPKLDPTRIPHAQHVPIPKEEFNLGNPKQTTQKSNGQVQPSMECQDRKPQITEFDAIKIKTEPTDDGFQEANGQTYSSKMCNLATVKDANHGGTGWESLLCEETDSAPESPHLEHSESKNNEVLVATCENRLDLNRDIGESSSKSQEELIPHREKTHSPTKEEYSVHQTDPTSGCQSLLESETAEVVSRVGVVTSNYGGNSRSWESLICTEKPVPLSPRRIPLSAQTMQETTVSGIVSCDSNLIYTVKDINTSHIFGITPLASVQDDTRGRDQVVENDSLEVTTSETDTSETSSSSNAEVKGAVPKARAGDSTDDRFHHECDVCSKMFVTYDEMFAHRRSHKLLSKETSISKSRKVLRALCPRYIVCQYCEKQFQTSSDYGNHLTYHCKRVNKLLIEGTEVSKRQDQSAGPVFVDKRHVGRKVGCNILNNAVASRTYLREMKMSDPREDKQGSAAPLVNSSVGSPSLEVQPSGSGLDSQEKHVDTGKTSPLVSNHRIAVSSSEYQSEEKMQSEILTQNTPSLVTPVNDKLYNAAAVPVSGEQFPLASGNLGMKSVGSPVPVNNFLVGNNIIQGHLIVTPRGTFLLPANNMVVTNRSTAADKAHPKASGVYRPLLPKQDLHNGGDNTTKLENGHPGRDLEWRPAILRRSNKLHKPFRRVLKRKRSTDDDFHPVMDEPSPQLEKREFACLQCDQKFTDRESLLTHAKQCSNKTRYNFRGGRLSYREFYDSDDSLSDI